MKMSARGCVVRVTAVVRGPLQGACGRRAGSAECARAGRRPGGVPLITSKHSTHYWHLSQCLSTVTAHNRSKHCNLYNKQISAGVLRSPQHANCLFTSSVRYQAADITIDLNL